MTTHRPPGYEQAPTIALATWTPDERIDWTEARLFPSHDMALSVLSARAMEMGLTCRFLLWVTGALPDTATELANALQRHPDEQLLCGAHGRVDVTCYRSEATTCCHAEQPWHDKR